MINLFPYKGNGLEFWYNPVQLLNVKDLDIFFEKQGEKCLCNGLKIPSVIRN